MAHEGLLGRILDYTDTTRFWIVVGALSIVFAFGYAYVVNRQSIARNEATLREHQVIVREQRAALAYLCRTVRLLDTGYVQQAAIARAEASDTNLPPSVRSLWRERLRVYQVIHVELSDTRACRQIE